MQQNKQKIQQQQQQQKQQKQKHHHHHQQQQSSQSSTMSGSPNPFSPSSNDHASQDQDMRIPLNSTSANEKLVELANQDVDMRILAIPHQTSTASEKSKFKKSDSDSFSNNTHLEKTNEQASSRKLIDYSQYLKDANIDLNQSDLEDPIGKCNKLYVLVFLQSLQKLLFF